MSLDLSAAVEAARDFIAGEVGFDGGPMMRMQADRLVSRVAPIIEAAVREQIAAEAWDECLVAMAKLNPVSESLAEFIKVALPNPYRRATTDVES